MDAAGQHLAVAVQVAQDGGDREDLEQRADREAFAGPVAHGAPGTDVVREDAEAGAVLLLQRAQTCGDVVLGGVRGAAREPGQQGGRGGGAGGEEGAAMRRA
ncbi:hypothetical protein GCM10010251_38030 [Streptomyces aurantiogriseus]|uniref:Uncharacterized protein n=1 Tax=Streptomyces aurantiogriseus TaxID=66870 RepID=A0A918CE26_9ACTN|nr:hypothetical protein GCM10010251_38030 [Streptomyces aurantiogriseus]